MKLRLSNKRTRALAWVEILVIIAVLAILAILFLPRFTKKPPHHYPRSVQINCVNNLKQIALALRIWEGDNNGKYPMSVSVTNGGGMELIAAGNVAGCLQVVSNELSTTKILICPADKRRVPAANFQNDFNNSHVSYFISPDADQFYPQQVMSGDDNLAINDVPVKSGMLVLSSNTPISWTAARHGSIENIGCADGSVFEVSTLGLKQALVKTGIATNRLAIP